MKKFVLLIAALLLPLQAMAITQSTYSVVIDSVGYEGDVLKVKTETALRTDCAVNDESNTFWIEPSAVQKVVAGITMSAHQDARQAILYYDYNSCDANGVTVIGAALKADINPNAPPSKFSPDYKLLETRQITNLEPVGNTTDKAQRIIISGVEEAEVRSNNMMCDYSFILTDATANNEMRVTNYDTGICNISQMSFNLAPNMTFKFQDHVIPDAKVNILIFGVQE